MMLPGRATHEGGGGVDPGIGMVLDRMLTDGPKISSDLEDIIQEIAQPHRGCGRTRAVDDDLVCSLRHAMMMPSFASPATGWGSGPLRRSLRRLA